MTADSGAERRPDHEKVGDVRPTRFRHTLFFPLALARAGKDGDFDAKRGPRDACCRLACALPRSGRGAWRELKELAANCEPFQEKPGEEAAAARYQETIFFHRFVQRFLYGDGGDACKRPMRVFRRCDVKEVTVELASVARFDSEDEKEGARDSWNAQVALGLKPKVASFGRPLTRAITLDVEAVNLHLFNAGVTILTLTVAARRGEDGAPLHIVRANGAQRAATLADFLDLAECFRRLYIPYWIKAAVGATPDDLRLLVCAEGVPAAVTWTMADGSMQRASAPLREEVAKAFVAGFSNGVPELLPWWKQLLPDALSRDSRFDQRLSFPF